MDEQKTKRIDEAARKLADVLIESQRIVSEHSVKAQGRQVQITQSFFERVTNLIRAQAEIGDAAARDLVEHARRGQEASQALARESVDTYMDFLDSMFSYYPRGMQTAERAARDMSPERSVESGGDAGDIQVDATRYPMRNWGQVSGRARTTFGASRTPGYAASTRRP